MTTSLDSEVEGLIEASDDLDAVDGVETAGEEFVKSESELLEPQESVEERKALEEALSSLAGKLRGRQEERRDVEGRYGWLRTSKRSQNATEWTSVTRKACRRAGPGI